MANKENDLIFEAYKKNINEDLKLKQDIGLAENGNLL